jgi:triosephosphate isomerase
MRIPVIAGNWKMHKSRDEAIKFVIELRKQLVKVGQVEVIICPPFTALDGVLAACDGSQIKVGAQNMHWEDEGAYTGEVSPAMLSDLGCQYVVIGHSERRRYFGETDQTVNKKVKAALAKGLIPIMCTGESLEEREQGNTKELIGKQLSQGLAGLSGDEISGVIIAYEPIWAIGTGKTATAEQAEEVCAFIREQLAVSFSQEVAEEIIIQYGGSVKPDNMGELMAQANIDGALVGGASLEPASFAAIVKFGEGQKS